MRSHLATGPSLFYRPWIFRTRDIHDAFMAVKLGSLVRLTLSPQTGFKKCSN